MRPTLVPVQGREVYSECEWFDRRIRRCQVVARTVQLENLHKLATVLLDRMTEGHPEAEGLARQLAERVRTELS